MKPLHESPKGQEIKLVLAKPLKIALEPEILQHINKTQTQKNGNMGTMSHNSPRQVQKNNNTNQNFSDDILKIYQALKQTPTYIQYQGAKQLYAESDTYDTQDIIYYWLEVFADETGHDLRGAIHQEKEEHAFNNIIQSETWIAEQKYCFFPILESCQDRTSHLQIKVIDCLLNKLETQLEESNTIAEARSKEWLQAKIEKNEKKKNNAWNAYITTNEYQLLETAKKQPQNLSLIRECNLSLEIIPEHYEYYKRNTKLKLLQQRLQKHDYLIPEENHQNLQLTLSNNKNNTL